MPRRKDRVFKLKKLANPFYDVFGWAKTLETVQLATQIVGTQQKPRLPGRKQRGFVLPATRLARQIRHVVPAWLVRSLVTHVYVVRFGDEVNIRSDLAQFKVHISPARA